MLPGSAAKSEDEPASRKPKFGGKVDEDDLMPEAAKLSKGQGKGGKKSKKKTDKKVAIKDQGFRSIIEMLIKSSLAASQQNREMAAIWCTTILMKKTGKAATIIEGMKAEGRNYAKATREAGKGHSLGPPGPGIFLAMMEALIILDIGGANRTKLTDLVEGWREADQETILEIAPIVKTAKCYSDDDLKLILSIRDRDLMKTITDSFKQIECRICLGKAPPGHMERELSEWLEALAA